MSPTRESTSSQRAIELLYGALDAPDPQSRAMVRAAISALAAPAPAGDAPVLVKAHAQNVGHRCAGCGYEWEGRLVGPELCGNCWRKTQPVLHGPPPWEDYQCSMSHKPIRFRTTDYATCPLCALTAEPGDGPADLVELVQRWQRACLVKFKSSTQVSDAAKAYDDLIAWTPAAPSAPTAIPPETDTCADCQHPREFHQRDGICGIEECGCMEFVAALTPDGGAR